MAIFQHISKGGKDSLTVILSDGTIKSIAGDHPGFNTILDALKAKESDDKIKGLLDPANLIFSKTSKVSERVTLAGGTLLFDGDALEGPLADFIVSIAQNSDNTESYEAWIKFMENLANNPSEESKEHLFAFMTTHGLTVNTDGHIILYKGVRSDGTSIHSGFGIVNGVQMDGNLPNEVGSVLEFPRSKVNANRGVACATGLHAGTFDYASSFAQGRLLTVAINPRDVVSVPSDHNDAKVRVSRYTVVEVNEQEQAYQRGVWGAHDDDFEDESDAVDEFFSDDEPEDEDEDDTVLIFVGDAQESAPAAPAVTDEFEAKVQAALVKIPAVLKSGWDKSLRLYISKNVTAGQRDAWREALRRTGLR